MHGLVLIAHGSRRQASNTQIMELGASLQDSVKDHFQVVETGFLEIASPSVAEAIESCIDNGATYITVVPYFLSAGRHVAEDIPAIVAQVARKHETVTINITEHVGAAEAMPGLILEAAICRS